MTFGYGRDARLTGWAVLAVTVVETAAVHLLLPWPAVRLVLLASGVLATLLLLATLADSAVRPHLLTDDHLRLRAGSRLVVDVPLADVAAVGRRRGQAEQAVELADGVLVLASGQQTDVELRLHAPQWWEAGGLAGQVASIRFAADAPAEVVAALRGALLTAPPPGRRRSAPPSP